MVDDKELAALRDKYIDACHNGGRSDECDTAEDYIAALEARHEQDRARVAELDAGAGRGVEVAGMGCNCPANAIEEEQGEVIGQICWFPFGPDACDPWGEIPETCPLRSGAVTLMLKEGT